MNEKEIDYNLLEVEKGNKRNGIYLKNHIQDQYKEIVRLIARIDKAIETINLMIYKGYTKSNKGTARTYMATTENSEFGVRAKELLDILKGSDKEWVKKD